MFNPNLFLHKNDIKDLPEFIPKDTPVSMRDVDMMPPMNMDQHMSDPCPNCKGFRMSVGEYVCWGFCSNCYEEAISTIER